MSLRIGKPGFRFGVHVADTRLALAISASEKANEDLTKEASG